MANRQYKQGIYEVKNKERYLGNKNPRYLSSYELEVFKALDRNPNVIGWGAEIVIVPYYSSVKQRQARYIVDVFLHYKDGKTGDEKKLLIEIKPSKDLEKPQRTRRKKEETFIQESLTYVTNREKWMAAYEYAKARGWEFTIWCEREIFGRSA